MRSAEERFLSRIEKTATCWNWTAAKNGHGYGQLRVNGKVAYAHRFSYDLFKGPIPEGLEIDHLCRNRNCVNPEHLEAVSKKTNILRGESFSALNADKTACAAGHKYTSENTYMRKAGGRDCRTCNREAVKRYRERVAA